MHKYFAELIGTFALVFCGTAAIVIDQVTGGAVSHVGVAITFGAIVLAMIYTFGDISGAHINPAVTIGFAVAKLFPISEIVPYIISQIAGALLASIMLRLLFPNSLLLGATMPVGSEIQSFSLELILTFLLMLVILGTSQGKKDKKPFVAIAVGFMVMLEALFAGPICGASMNPVRSLAPALISGHIEHLWLYLVAPVCGSLLAVIIWGRTNLTKTI